MEQITDLQDIEPGETLRIQGNGMDEVGEFGETQESTWGVNDNPMGFVNAEEATFTVQEPKDHPLQNNDSDLFSIGGRGKAKLFRE